MENEELAKSQGRFESENQNNPESAGEINEAAESQGLEQMGIEAEQNVSQVLESAQAEIGKEFDVIAHYEAAFAEDVGTAKKEGENILAQNERDAQEAKQEIKSALDLAKESSKGQMTELEKKWASENGEAETSAQNAEVVGAPPVQEKKPLKTSWEIASDKLKAMDQVQNNENAENNANNKIAEEFKDDENIPAKRFVKISPNILGKDAPIKIEKNEAFAKSDSEKQYVKISPNILGKDLPIDLSERGETAMPEAPKQEDVKAEEDKYKPRDSKFIKISENILGKESSSNDEREKIPDQLMKEAEEVFEKIPDNEKIGLLKGLAGLGFKSQEWKGKIFKKIFNEAAKKAADWTEKGEQSIIARLCSSYVDIYKGVEDQAKAKQDQLYNQKGGAVNTAFGIGALAGNALLYGRMAADITYVNPMRNVTAGAMFLGRGGEAMKEAQLKSHEVIDKGRAQDEDEAYDQAMALYEQAKEKSPDGKVSAENLSKMYKENLPKDLLNRLNKDQDKEGICSRVSQKIAKADIEYSLKKIDKQIKSVESDDDLNPSEKASAKNKILKKYDKFLKDMDRIVGNGGKVDLISYGSRLTEKAGKATASFMMLETLAEGIVHGGTALAALSTGEGDHSPEFVFGGDNVGFEHGGVEHGNHIIGGEIPIEAHHGAPIAEHFGHAETAAHAPTEHISGGNDAPNAIGHDAAYEIKNEAMADQMLHDAGLIDDKHYADFNASTLEKAGVSEIDIHNLTQGDLTHLTPEQIAGIHDYNLKIDALKGAGFSQGDLNQLSVDDIRSFSAEQIRQHALENQINADFDAHAHEVGAHHFEEINNKAAAEHINGGLHESHGDQTHESAQKLDIDKDFFKENPAAIPEIHTPNNIHIANDKLVADIEFKYNSSGQPVEILTPKIQADAHIDQLNYLDRSNLQSFDARADGIRLSTYMEIYNGLKSEKLSAEAGVVAEKIKDVIGGIEKTRHGIIDYSKLPQEIREKLGK